MGAESHSIGPGSAECADRPHCAPQRLVLSPGEFLAAVVVACTALACCVAWSASRPAQRCENYRIPAGMADDYWLLSRLARADGRAIAVLGDSVMWGYYVPADRTLPAALGRHLAPARFVNISADGLHPAAMNGFVRCFGRGLAGRRVLVHMNPLWMSSPRHDLSSRELPPVNHPRLLPQFIGAPAGYRQGVAHRLAVVVERAWPAALWSAHLRAAHFEGVDAPTWSLRHPYACPASAVMAGVADERWRTAKGDGRPSSARGAEFHAEWVGPGRSYQWRAFEEMLDALRGRSAGVFVLVGPLNEHMMEPANLAQYRQVLADIAARLQRGNVAHHVARALPPQQYADVSHPLAEGYDVLAGELAGNEMFRRFAFGE